MRATNDHLAEDPTSTLRDLRIDALISTPTIGAQSVSQFIPITNPTTKGIDVSFSLTSIKGMGSLSLLRASVQDVAQATVLQTWTASVSAFTWSDTDVKLQQYGQAFYWLRLEPVNSTGTAVVVGPEFILLNPSLLPPLAVLGISASHAAASNGTILVTCNITGIPAGNSVKIYVTGYEGNASAVAVAQRSSAPLQFTLQATGETVTLRAIAVSPGGAEAVSGPTTSLILNGSATVPAKPQNVTVAQLSTGDQVMWPANLESGITAYQVWRGQRGDSFLSASLLATVSTTGVGTVQYLDTGGLGGDYQYFIIAVGVGNSIQSDPANPTVLYSSATIPSNVPANTTNTATIDSVDAGSNALVRVYGAGGVGTGYTRVAGFGSPNRPYGSISGLAYLTKYAILYNTANQTYLASTTYAPTLPDYYEWVGVLTTTAASGLSGTGATATAVVDAFGHVTQVNPTTVGSGYVTASVNISGGGGSGAVATANVVSGQVTSYTVTNGGTAYASAPTIAVIAGSAGGTTGGGGSTGTSLGSRGAGNYVF